MSDIVERCPIGLDNNYSLCSAGTCTVCRLTRDVERLRAENAALKEDKEKWIALAEANQKVAETAQRRADREALKGNAEPVAWMVKAKHGLIRACWSEKPSDEQVAVAHADGDTITPLFTSPR